MEMAAAVGLASAITALIGNVVTVGQYIGDFKSAIKENQKWREDLEGLVKLLKQLEKHAQQAAAHPDDPEYEAFLNAIQDGGTLMDGKYNVDVSFRSGGILSLLEKRVGELLEMLQPKHGLPKLWKRLTYTIDKGDIAAKFRRINDLKSHLDSFIQLGLFNLSENIYSNQKVEFMAIQAKLLNQEQRAEKIEEAEIIKWLSPLEFLKKQKETSDQIFPTGAWLLESVEFTAWLQGREWPLHCYGAPGAGKVSVALALETNQVDLTIPKSVLSSILINYIQDHCERQAMDQSMAVLFLYLDHTETKTQTSQNLLGSLLKQLLQSRQGARPLPDAVTELYQNSKGEIRPNTDDFCEVLSSEIRNSYDRVYVVVDALDEFPEIGQAELLTTLENIEPKKVSLLMTSRPLDYRPREKNVMCQVLGETNLSLYFHCDTCPSFDVCQSCLDNGNTCGFPGHNFTEPQFVVKEIRAPDKEIEAFVRWELKKQLGFANSRKGDSRLGNAQIVSTRLYINCQKDNKLEDDIPPAVVSKANGMFLLAKLHLESLKMKATPADVRRALTELSEEIGGIYGKIMQRIDEQNTKTDAALAMKALSWVVCTNRPLTVLEFQEALAIRPKSTEIGAGEQPDLDILLRITAGLITTGASTTGGEPDTISLAHKTAYEYFEANRKMMFPPPALSNIAMACLTYLNFPALSKPFPDDQANLDISRRFNELPFLAYAAQYWADHALADLDNPKTKEAIIELLINPSKLAATVQAAWYAGSKSPNSVSWDVRKGVDCLHVCAYYGLDFAIPTLLQRDSTLDIDSRDLTFGQTPLMYACKRGHIKTVSTLLDCGADVNIPSDRGSTAILEAISCNHPHVVNILIKKPLNVNKVYSHLSGRTALMVAVLNESTTIVSHLLHESGIHVNVQDSKGYTALALAATTKSAALVEHFLDRDGIKIDLRNENGATALIIAAECGNAEMVKQMLEHHADPSLKDTDGITAIVKAMDCGHIPVVEMMLDRVAIDILVSDNSGRSLLNSACASQKAPPDIVHLLVGRQMNPNTVCKGGGTPLHDASRVGRVEMTEALLQVGAIPSITDAYHRTPFKVAWQHGAEDIMKVLAKQTNEFVPADARLPLWSHAKLGHLDSVREIIQTGSSNLHARDPDSNKTALHWAVDCDNVETHPDILQLLLEAGLSPNDYDNNKVTPMHVAAYLGYTEDAEAMLKYDAQLELRDERGFTALEAAQSNDHYGVAVTLIEGGACIENGRPTRLQLTFIHAVERGASKAVELLIEKGADALGRSESGETALKIATVLGYEDVISILQLKT
ncbi:MAG: hypothetical protein LQ347_003244 [Umbilicaria vellea]|nr:MAG: hypothetical protein LQ347_003244 [Umbilicaria vellea]